MTTFSNWMNQRHKGFFCAGLPCVNWMVNGVLVTLWLQNKIVKIYHDQGRHTEWHPADTERCREAVMSLESSYDPRRSE